MAIRITKMRRTNSRNGSFVFLVMVVMGSILLQISRSPFSVVQGQNYGQHQQQPQCPNSSANTNTNNNNNDLVQYEWERYNYYELLGIPNPHNKILKEETDAAAIATKKKQRGRRRKQKDGETKDDHSSTGTESNGEHTHQQHQPVSNKEIRKAYRKQAQKYHPDKQISNINRNKNENTHNSNKTTTTKTTMKTLEESNARFAKIAEAYELLTDPTKRDEYDLFLDYCQTFEVDPEKGARIEDRVGRGGAGRISTMLKSKFHTLFTDFAGTGKDPLSVFEDFLFGNDDDDDDDEADVARGGTYHTFDPQDPFSHLQYKHNLRQQQRQRDEWRKDQLDGEDADTEDDFDDEDEQHAYDEEEPVRVYHEQQNMYDPMTGETVIRVLQTEEFDPLPPHSTKTNTTTSSKASAAASSTRVYYRIVAQDFKESYDPYNAKNVFVAITEPYIHEDGHRTQAASSSRSDPTNNSSSSSSSSSKSNSILESILHSWEVLTPDSRLIVSPNKRYVLGLSQDCEFIIMTNNEYYPDKHDTRRNTILWSTNRPYGSDGYAANNCFALLKGPHLVVTVGQHPHSIGASMNSNRILWHSDSSRDDADDDDNNGYYEYEDEYGFWHKRQRSYLAQLGNDGSLTIYSVWNVPQQHHQEDQHARRRERKRRRSGNSSHRYSGNSNNNFFSSSLHNSYYYYNVIADKSKLISHKAWLTAKDMVHGRVPVNDEYDHLYYHHPHHHNAPTSSSSSSSPFSSSSSSSSSSITYKRCIYSTSKVSFVGCNRLGRKVTEVAFELYFRLHRMVSRINEYTDSWLDLFMEEDDILRSIKESVLTNGRGTAEMVTASTKKLARKILEFLIVRIKQQHQQV